LVSPYDAESVLHEVVGGLRDAAPGPTPGVLRPRTVIKQLAERTRNGPISQRPEP